MSPRGGSLWSRAVGWQDQVEGGAAARIVRPPEATPVRHGNGAADGEAKAQPGGFGREERFEQLILGALGQPEAGIRDGYLDVPLIEQRNVQTQVPLGARDLAHRLAGVDDQVQHDRRELHRIGPYPRKPRSELRLHVSSCELDRAARERQRIADYRLDIERPEIRLAPFE